MSPSPYIYNANFFPQPTPPPPPPQPLHFWSAYPPQPPPKKKKTHCFSKPKDPPAQIFNILPPSPAYCTPQPYFPPPSPPPSPPSRCSPYVQVNIPQPQPVQVVYHCPPKPPKPSPPYDFAKPPSRAQSNASYALAVPSGTELTVAVGGVKWSLQVVAADKGEFITLLDIHKALHDISHDIKWRYCSLPWSTQHQVGAAFQDRVETKGGIREEGMKNVDFLMGKTRFNGCCTSEKHKWELCVQ